MEELAAATHRGERTAAAESGYLSMSAAVLGEHGMVRLREPLDAKLFDLAVRLLDGTYPKPFVIDHEGMRRLHFNLAHIQSEMRIAEPDALCAGYTQAMMSFVLFRPRRRVSAAPRPRFRVHQASRSTLRATGWPTGDFPKPRSPGSLPPEPFESAHPP